MEDLLTHGINLAAEGIGHYIGNKRQRSSSAATVRESARDEIQADEVGATSNNTIGKYASGGQITWRAKKRSRRAQHRAKRRYIADVYNSLRDANPNVFIRTKSNSFSSNLNNQVITFLPPLYSWYGTNGDYDDVTDVAINMQQDASGQEWPASSLIKSKVAFLKAHQEITITNVYNSVNTEAIPSIMFLNVYKYYVRKDSDVSNPNSLWVQQSATNGGTGLVSTDFGTLPFDFAEVVDKIKLISKEEIQLGVGETINLDLKSHGLKLFDGMAIDTVSTNGMWGKAGWTTGFIVHAWGAPYKNSSIEVYQTATQCLFTVTNRYTCKYLPHVSHVTTLQNI